MAKTKMLCPFTKGFCKECSQYRGRHYYLCYCKKYRGYLEASEAMNDQSPAKKNTVLMREISSLIPRDSTWLVLDDILERSWK